MKKIILLSITFLFIAAPCLCSDFPSMGHGALSSATGRFVLGQISESRIDLPPKNRSSFYVRILT
jgi:hypothetical protein